MPSKTRKRQPILTGRLPSLKKNTRKHKHNKQVVKADSSSARAAGALKKPIVPTFLHMLNTIKLYHWKTMSYATHKATDELYAKMGELIDHFVEVMLGKEEMGGRTKILNVPVLNLSLYSSNNEFKKEVERYKSFLIDLSKDAKFSSSMNVDLIAIRDEILAELNKFLYLLSLK
jgi:DNA-binding ferritin-like protein